MGRARTSIARSRVRWYRRVLLDPAALRYWLAVAALAIVVAASVASVVARAQAARARWGDTAEVWVVDADLGAGAAVDGALRREAWPEALIPADALATGPGEGARTAVPVTEGQVLTAAALDPRSGPGALDGRRTVAVPRGESPLAVEAGQRVELWAVAGPTVVADGADPTTRLAADAVVVAVAERTVTVAVAPDDVGPVAAAAALSAVAVVGRP